MMDFPADDEDGIKVEAWRAWIQRGDRREKAPDYRMKVIATTIVSLLAILGSIYLTIAK